MKIAGVVVLYQPDKKVIANIKTYINQVDILYAVDNSDKKNHKLIEILEKSLKIQYVDNGGNKGIAAALNVGAVSAIRAGYEYLLTMDQDSRCSEHMVERLAEYFKMHSGEHIGIVSAFQEISSEKSIYHLKKEEQLQTVMTSGNLLNLTAYKKVGKFLNKYFIDHVDNEYCLRLNKRGYKVVRLNDVILHHNLGVPVNVAGIAKSLHSPVRLYYIVRNSLDMCERYEKDFPNYIAHERVERKKEIRKNLLYGKHRCRQIYYLIKAIVDYKTNHFGKVS